MTRFSQIAALIVCALALGHQKPAYAGAANASVTCKGVDKNSNVQLAGNIPGDFAEYNVVVKNGSLEKTWSDSDYPMILSVADFSRGVFFIGVPDAFYMYADPATVQSNTDKAGQRHASFTALLSAPALASPELGAVGGLDGARVKCTYEYTV